MARWALGWLIVAALASVGCAFTDLTLAPPQRRVGAPASRRGANRAIVVVSPFTNRRPAARCGMKKNGYNMDTANVFCREAPEAVLPHLLAQELREAGFRVVMDRSKAAPGTPIVRGLVDQYFVEPKVNVVSGAMETDVAIVLRVELPHERIAVRKFYVKGDEATFLSPDEDMALAQNSAVREVLLDSVGALANLMDRLPPEPAAAAEPAPASADAAEAP